MDVWICDTKLWMLMRTKAQGKSFENETSSSSVVDAVLSSSWSLGVKKPLSSSTWDAWKEDFV